MFSSFQTIFKALEKLTQLISFGNMFPKCACIFIFVELNCILIDFVKN